MSASPHPMPGTGTQDWPEGYGRVHLAEVGSTQDAVFDRVGEIAGSFWLIADRQTKARGRRGRAWLMPPGNFAATLLLRIEEPPQRAALRSFVMSLALLRAVSEVRAAGPRLALKWPNDVLLDGRKLAGILLENRTGIGLAIGVGVNLAQSPEADGLEAGALRPVALAEATGVSVPPERFLERLAGHYAGLERQFATFGFGPIREEWLAHAARLGQTITARVGRETRTGIFEDVDVHGHLVLRGDRGRETIAAADVHF